MADKETKISEQTYLSFSIMGVICAGVFLISGIYSETSANAQSVMEIRQQQKDDRKEILELLAVLNAKIDRLIENKR